MDRLTPAQWAGVAIGAVCVGLGSWFFWNPGIFGKVSVIVYHNAFFWVLIGGGVLYAAFRKWRNPDEFAWAELPVQIGASALVLLLLCEIFFYYGSDLHDIEVWNGKAVKATYYEEHDVRTCTTTCDSKGTNCTTTCTCSTWPPSWVVETNNERRGAETIGISPINYSHYVQNFGNQRLAGSQGDSCNGNPGLIHETIYLGDPDKLVPTAIEHPFVNYLKASKSIRKTTGGQTEGFEEYLKPYPRVHNGMFGEIYLDRVIISGNIVPEDKKADLERWAASLDNLLDRALADLGKRKEVNILVYLVGTEDRKFFYALDEAWVHAKKNDVVLIIGTPEFPKVAWADTIAWSKTTDFAINLRNHVQKMGNIGDSSALAQTMLSQLDLPLEQGGFERMSMEELAYMSRDVEIAWWAMFLILILYGFLTWLCSWALENNEIRGFATRAYDTAYNNTFGRVSGGWRRRNFDE